MTDPDLGDLDVEADEEGAEAGTFASATAAASFSTTTAAGTFTSTSTGGDT